MKGTLGSLDSLSGLPLQLALDRTGVGLAACDAAGRLTLLSPMLQGLLDMAYEPVSESHHVERFRLFRSDGVTVLPTEEVPLVRARKGEFVRDAVITSRRADGTLCHFRCNASPLRDERGQADGAIALIQDVSAETEAALRAEALRTRVVDTINHEFRTPLAALLGHVELAKQHRDRLDPELVSWLEAIERSGWKLRDLVEEVAEMVTGAVDERPVDRRPRRLA